MAEEFAQRADDIGQVEIARRHLVEHRGEEEEIFLSDEGDFDVGVAALFEFERGVEAAEAAAENENTGLFHVRRVWIGGWNSVCLAGIVAG